MTRITEQQLRENAQSLQEKLVTEYGWNPSSWFNGRPMGDATSRDDVRTQDAQKNSQGGASSALVQNREQLAPGTTASETGSDGIVYGVDDKGQRTYQLDPAQQKWVKMATPAPAENPELQGQPAAPEAPPAAPEAPAAVTPAAAPASPYVVKKGDNLTNIAKGMGTTLQDLLKANPQFQKNPNLIYPGQKVNPPGASAPAAPTAPAAGQKEAPQGFTKPTPPGTVPTPPATQGQYIKVESTVYKEDQSLARIISLARGR